MKIARTFTIDYHLYQKLRQKPNQSRIVERAVKQYLNESAEYDYTHINTKRLLMEMTMREDCPNHIKLLINDYLKS